MAPRRLRQIRWKEWKRIRTKRRKLIAHGIPEGQAHEWACSRKGYWRIAGSAPLQRALPNSYWHKTMGLQGLLNPYRRFRDATRTAGCGPARPVVWGAPGVSPAPTRLRSGPGNGQLVDLRGARPRPAREIQPHVLRLGG
jgi:hypothetical protein